MNPNPAPNNQEQVPKMPDRIRHRPNRMSFICSVLAFALLVLIPVVRNSMEDIDRQYANFAGIGCGLLGLLFAQLSFATHRAVPWFFKIAVFAFPPMLLLGFLANYEFTGFNGEVWPTFRSRGSSTRIKRDSEQPKSDLPLAHTNVSVHQYRFSQFLGNHRTGVVDAPEFSMAWDRKLPTIAWRRNIGEGWSGFAVANGLAITIFQREDKEVVAAWLLDSGKTVWEYEAPGRHTNALGGTGPRSTPTVVSIPAYETTSHQADADAPSPNPPASAEAGESKELVIAQTALGIVVCLDAVTGNLLWKTNLLERAGINQQQAEKGVMWGRSGSPLVVGDLVVVPFGGPKDSSVTVNSLIALDIRTGEEKWIGGNNQISYASPALLTIDGVPQIVSVNEGNVTGHDISTGRVLWESLWPSKSDGDACASQPVQIDSNRILLGKGYAQGSKMILVQRNQDTNSESPQTWQSFDQWADTRTLKTKFTNAVIYEGRAYALSDGVLECVNPMNGSRMWRGKRYGQGQMLIVNGSILVSAEDGRIVSVDSESGKPIAEMEALAGITWNIPAVAGPFLLVRNANEAVCLLSPRE